MAGTPGGGGTSVSRIGSPPGFVARDAEAPGPPAGSETHDGITKAATSSTGVKQKRFNIP